jgi:hypothetical protein
MDVLKNSDLASQVAPISDPEADIDEGALNILTREPDIDAIPEPS